MQEIKKMISGWSSKHFGSKGYMVQEALIATLKIMDSRNDKLRKSVEVLQLFTPPDNGGKLWFRKNGFGYTVVPTAEDLLSSIQNGELEFIECIPKNKRVKFIKKWLKARQDDVPTVRDMCISGTCPPPSPEISKYLRESRVTAFSESLEEYESLTNNDALIPIPIFELRSSFWPTQPTLLEKVFGGLRRSLGFLIRN